MTRSTGAALLAGMILVGCSGGDGGVPPPEPDGGGTDAAEDVPSTLMTWTELYAAYFGPSTPGHCGSSSSCHLTSRAGFLCGTTADSCYKGLVAAALVDPAHPTMSPIADPNQSPLAWFGAGNMPQDNPVGNTRAQKDIAAWVAAGAQEN
jgi:hypothetical protein